MVYVRQTSGFTFTNSVMRYAGVLGMYIGHDNEKSSNRILIEHNHFYENATNALAIQGVTGQKKNIIRENLFERNHIYGRFAVAPKYGTGMTGGGQLYIANVDNMLVIGNTIDDGYCLNCYRSNRPDGQFKDITGIEISGNYGNQIRVTNLTITENIITNNDAWGIGQNVNSTIDGTTKIFNNTVNGNGKQFRFQVGFSGS